MKTVLNFSHPLSAQAVARLREMMKEDVSVVDIRVQIDFSQSVKEQIDALVEIAFRHLPIAAVIPPGMSTVGGPLVARLSYAQSDAMLPVPPPIVVMARDETAIFSAFMPVEIMRW